MTNGDGRVDDVGSGMDSRWVAEQDQVHRRLAAAGDEAIERLGAWRSFDGAVHLPLFDSFGRRASFSVQLVPPDTEALGGLRALPPGLVLACPLGRRLLAREGGRFDRVAYELVRRSGVWIVGGLLHWARVALERSESDERAPAAFGLPHAQSWTEWLTRRIPRESRVTLDVAAHVEELLSPALLDRRCELRRPRG